jgi:tetratricopeptide (TPR) repeat protein
LKQGSFQAAADTYRESISLDPHNPQLHYNLSLALSKLGDRRAEQRELKTALELDPTLTEAHNRLGICYLDDKQAAQAEGEFKRALALSPRYAEAEYNLGVLYAQEGRNSQAASLLRQATQHNPEYQQAYLALGLALAGQGYYLRAAEQFETAIRLSPDSAEAYSALGKVQAKLGRLKDSVRSFQKVIALHPDSSDAHLNLGFALADQNDMPGALEEFSEAVRLDPNSALAHYNRGRLLYQWARNEEARAELESACRLAPDYGAALYLLALLESHENNLSRSTELSRKVVALEPRNPDAQFLLGQNLFLSGKREEAIQHWEMAIESDPKHSESLYNLARTLGQLHRPEAKQYRDRYEALQQGPQVTEQVKKLGNLALDAANARNWSEAVAQLRKALELCGQCSERAHLHKDLGLIYCRSGVVEMCERELQTALELNPNDEDVLKALEVLQKLRNEKKTSPNGGG